MIKKYFEENLTPYQLGQKDVNCQFYINTRDYPLEHSHENYWEFSVVLEGKIDNMLNGSVRSCPTGTMFYCTTNDVHYIIAKSTDVRYVNFTIKESALLQILSTFSQETQNRIKRNERIFSLSSNMIVNIEQVIHNLNLLQQEEYSVANDLISAQVMSFVQYIVKQVYSNDVSGEPNWLQELERLKQHENFITFTVSDLCRELNYSRVQLNRLFKAKFATTPHDYLLSNKLLYAYNLLVSTDMNTIDIANAIGYANLAQFNIVFKNRFGVTPGQCRKWLVINWRHKQYRKFGCAAFIKNNNIFNGQTFVGKIVSSCILKS